MKRFLVVIEKAKNNYSAYSPDLPGCVATGKTREETEQNMLQAIDLHVAGLLEDNLPVPESSSFAEYIALPSPRERKMSSSGSANQRSRQAPNLFKGRKKLLPPSSRKEKGRKFG